MDFYTKKVSFFIFFALATSQSLLCSVEERNQKTWYAQQAPCPPTSSQGSRINPSQQPFNKTAQQRAVILAQNYMNSKGLRRTQSENDLPRQKVMPCDMHDKSQIIASAMDAASQAHTAQVKTPILMRGLKLVPWEIKPKYFRLEAQDPQDESSIFQQKIASTSDVLKNGEDALKARSQNLFMKKCIAQVVGALLAGAAFYSTTPEGTRSGKVIGIDDFTGVAYLKAFIEPLCCAALGGFIFNGAYNLIYGTMQEQINIQQHTITGLQTKLTDIQKILSGCEAKTDKMEHNLSHIVPQVDTMQADITTMKDDSKRTLDITETLYKQVQQSNKQLQQSELDRVVQDAEEITQEINDLSAISKANFEKEKEDKKKEKHSFGIARFLGIKK